MFAGKSDGAGTEPFAQRVVRSELQDRVHNAESIDFIEYPRVFAMTGEAAHICPRQNDWSTHCEKFRQLPREAIFVEGIVAAGLDQRVSQAEERRNFLVGNLAQLD